MASTAESNYRLTDDVIPLLYSINLDLDMSDFVFKGIVNIDVIVSSIYVTYWNFNCLRKSLLICHSNDGTGNVDHMVNITTKFVSYIYGMNSY